MNKKNTINYPKSAATGFFSKGLKNEFETVVVNEPSVLEPLKFYCMCICFLVKTLTINCKAVKISNSSPGPDL